VRVRKNPDTIAVALLCGILTALFFDVLFLGNCFHERDLTVFYYPSKHIVREALLSGELPLWNPNYASGQPLAANPEYEVWYPLQLLVLLPDYFLGFRLHILIHFYLAAIGMYALLRSLELEPPGAFFGALIYSIGGPLLSLTNLLVFLFPMAWLPLVLLFARRFLRAPNRRDFAITVILLGIVATIGEPTTLTQIWALVGLYAIYHAWTTRRRSWRELGLAAARGAALIVAGFLAGAVQLIPAADHARDSVRRAGFTFDVVTHWSMHPGRILEIPFPRLLRSMFNDAGETMLTRYNNGASFITDFSFGVLAAILAIAALAVWSRRTPFLLIGIAGSWFIAAGHHTPLWKVLFDLGPARSLRYPEKFALTGLFLLVILVAIVFDRFARGEKTKPVFVTAILWTSFALLAALAAAGVVPPMDEQYRPPGFTMVSPRMYWLDLAMRGAIVAVFAWQISKRKQRMPWIAALLALAALDLARNYKEVALRQPREYFEQPAMIASLPKKAQPYRVFHRADWEWRYGSPVSGQYFNDVRRFFWMERNGAFPSFPARWGVELALEQDFDQTYLTPTSEFIQTMVDIWRRTGQWPELYEAMTNVHYRAVFRPLPPDLSPRTEPVQLIPTPEHPRFYFADQIEQIAGRYDFADRVARGGLSPRVALVESAFPPATGTVHSATQSFTRISLDVSSAGRGLLVLAVTPHKYWRATIDGRAVPLGIANLASMAVEVPAGRHRVEVRYSNPLVLVCGIVSLLVVMGCVVAAAMTPVTTDSL
jgi:hypothetical protein